MNKSRCRFCGKKIPKWAYSNALFCSDICRKRHYDVTKRPKHNKRAVKSLEDVAENDFEEQSKDNFIGGYTINK